MHIGSGINIDRRYQQCVRFYSEDGYFKKAEMSNRKLKNRNKLRTRAKQQSVWFGFLRWEDISFL